MFKSVHNKVWAFDVEWVPDPLAGRLVYDLPEDMPDAEVMGEMWKRGGATDENPRPFLKTILCKVVSLSMVSRKKEGEDVTVHLHSLPQIGETAEDKKSENRIIRDFLESVGKHKPQVVGYNSVRADLRILVQRAVTNGLSIPSFAKRPDKPWEGADYFSGFSEWNVDMMNIVGGNKSTPSLNELARLSGIPGKMGVDGNEVAPMWLEGRIDDIVRYNEFDALTTYLLWLRFAHFGGFFNADQYAREQELVMEMIEIQAASGCNHLNNYIKEWNRLKSAVS
ncbi:MAG: hypothetical protein GKS04_04845 [Candidatus Mycalebacterium zealandia]|nr:MAG: hypothetical protein GKS04_04845 [Candidatus Mycalebacterium zealandia]